MTRYPKTGKGTKWTVRELKAVTQDWRGDSLADSEGLTGEVRAKLSDGTTHPFAVNSGIIEVQPSSKVVILADRSELATEIDVERAQEAYKRAQEAMKSSRDAVDIDYARFEALMNKELNRVKIAKRWR